MNTPTPKFPVRRRAAEIAAAAKPSPAEPAPPPVPSQRAPTRATAPALPARAARPKRAASAYQPSPTPSPPPTPRKTPEELRAARTRIRTRRAKRAIAALNAREPEIVAFMLEATNGKGWPWPKAVHASLAEHLGVSRIVARMYLGALRRTLGLPIRYDVDGPLLKTLAWRQKARRTGDYGSLAPLRPPEALAVPPPP